MANMTDTTATTGAPHPDAVAVADWLAGDRSALAVIYDRYGQSLFDTAAAMTGDRNDASDMVQDVFVLAAERLAQLRDPSRLKPWLFAILRNEVYRRSRRRSRTTTTDFGDPERDVMLPPTADHTAAVDDQIAHDDLAELVRGAARGLDQRDQLVLELSMRQGLSGDDLADALGVTAQQSYGLVHRMRERTERSLGAFCVARRGRRDCTELASILGNWDGEFSVLLRKRVARHIDACSTCERSRKKYAPLALIGAAPAFAAPLELRDLIVSSTPAPTPGGGGGTGLDTSTGFPRLLGSAARAVRTGIMITIGTAAGFAAVIGGGSILLDDGPEETTEAGTRLVVVDTPESADQPGEQRVEMVVIDPTTTTIDAATTVPAPVATTPAVATAPPVVVVPADGPATPTTLASPETTTPPATTTPSTTTTPPASTVPATTTPADTTAPPTTTAPTPAEFAVDATALDFGTISEALNLVITNNGDIAAVPVIVIDGPEGTFTIADTPGSIGAGESVTVKVGFDRGVGNEPSTSATMTISSESAQAIVAITGEVPTPTVSYVDQSCDFDDNDALRLRFAVTHHVARGPIVLTTNADVDRGGRLVGEPSEANGIVTEIYEIGYFSYDAAELEATDNSGSGMSGSFGPMKLRGPCPG